VVKYQKYFFVSVLPIFLKNRNFDTDAYCMLEQTWFLFSFADCFCKSTTTHVQLQEYTVNEQDLKEVGFVV